MDMDMDAGVHLPSKSEILQLMYNEEMDFHMLPTFN